MLPCGVRSKRQAKTLNALLFDDFISFEELVARQAVFCLSRLADDVVAFHEVARIIAEADDFWQAGVFLEVFDVADIIEVDDGAELDGLLEFIGRRIIRRQENFFAFDTRDIRDDELGEAAAVGACAFFVQNLDNARIRQGLDGELLAETRGPGKGLLQIADVLADGMFVVDVERRRILLDDFLKLCLGEREGLLAHKICPPVKRK